MPEDRGSSPEFRESSRAPLQAPAEIQLDAFSDPLIGQTVNISLGGLFLKLKDPPPVGSVIRFTIELGSPVTTISGTGEVVWIRAHGQGTERPAGMGVQFRYVEEEGAGLLRAEVEKALEELGPEPEEPPRRRPPPARPGPARPRPQAEPASRTDTRRQEHQKRAPQAKRTAGADWQILGVPANKVKVVMLLVLFAILALVVLL